MSKKKKQQKQSEHERHKIQEAQQRNAYIKRLLGLTKAMGFEEVVGLLTRDLLHDLYLLRPTLARMDLSGAKEYSKHERVYIQRDFYRVMQMHEMPFTEAEGEERMMSISDFYEVWMSFVSELNRESGKLSTDRTKAAILEVLGDSGRMYVGDEVRDEAPSAFEMLFISMERNYETVLLRFLFQLSNPCMSFLWVRRTDFETLNGRINRVVKFESCLPQWEWGTDKRGNRRKIFRVGLPLAMRDEVLWVSAKIPRNPYIHFDPEGLYDVFIQEHAVNRMFERLDGVSEAAVNIYMNFCFADWKADWYKGSLLIPFYLFGERVGYFLADFTEDKKIIIRTFYFITYDRTPEGEALLSFSGLQAEDKKYLSIDRLSTFLMSDIDKKSKFATVFREAGCGHLLDLSGLKRSIQKEAQFKSISNEFIAKYLSTLEE